MKYNNHPRPPIRCLSGETLVRIADRLAGMLNLTAVDPIVVKATAFTSDMPGSYFAYYIARPVSGHPAYEVSRRITVNVVEEPAAPVVSEAAETFPEDEPADEDSEDDPYEESETDDSEEAAFEDEGDYEEEYIYAEEFPEGDEDSEEDDSWDDYAEDEDSDWEEESDADGNADPGVDEYAGEYDNDEYSEEDLTLEDWNESIPWTCRTGILSRRWSRTSSRRRA